MAVAVRALRVSGRTNGTWSISWSDPCPQRICGRPPSQHQHRRVVLVRRRDRAHAVRDAGARRQRAHARLPRHLRPPLGGEGGGRLVASVDQVDALVAAAVVKREEVSAGQREQLRDAVRLQPPGGEQPAVRMLLLGCLLRSGARRLGLVSRRHAGAGHYLNDRRLGELRTRARPPIGVVLAGGLAKRMGEPEDDGAARGQAVDRAPAVGARARRPGGGGRDEGRHGATGAGCARVGRAATSRCTRLPGSSPRWTARGRAVRRHRL